MLSSVDARGFGDWCPWHLNQIFAEVKMNDKLLGDSIEALIRLRSELHDSVEDSVLEVLDKAISDLEIIRQGSDKVSANDVLHILGQVLEKLPMVVELIRLLVECLQ